MLLTFHELATLPQLSKIASSELDVGFVRATTLPPPPTVSLAVLHREPLVVVLPAVSPLARRRRIAAGDLRDEKFIVFPKDAGTGIYQQVVDLCRDAGFAPSIAMEAGEPSTVVGLVAAGCGIAILPESCNAIHMDGAVYRALGDTAATTALLLARHSDGGGPMVEAFVTLARAGAMAGLPG